MTNKNNSILESSKSNGRNKNFQDTNSNQNTSFIQNDKFHTLNSNYLNILEIKEG